VVDVFARVSTFQGSPENFDAANQQARETVLPAARQMSGFKGMLMLGDRSTGKGLAITLWESEEALRASEDAASKLRSQSAADTGGQIVGVERFEVVLDERG